VAFLAQQKLAYNTLAAVLEPVERDPKMDTPTKMLVAGVVALGIEQARLVSEIKYLENSGEYPHDVTPEDRKDFDQIRTGLAKDLEKLMPDHPALRTEVMARFEMAITAELDRGGSSVWSKM